MRIFREPLVIFLSLGVAIFIIDVLLNGGQAGENDIIITRDDIRRINTLYQQNWNQAPDELTSEKLLEEYINSEIYYKEALKLQLDHNDEIIKRRLRQKYEFLAQDIADLADPSEEELKSYHNAHNDQYLRPMQVSFTQYYINPDVHKDPVRQANILKRSLSTSDVDKRGTGGDNSHLDQSYVRQDAASITRIFGEDFADELFRDTSIGWHGPIRSGYGYHIILYEEVLPEQTLAYDEVIDEVLEDWKSDNRAELQESLISGLRKNYKIIHRYED